jgi:sigma-B regulation protein RsbU (phosphoserine phosphatase)
MDKEALQRKLFSRNPERRASEGNSNLNRRESERRRTRNIGWLKLFKEVDENAVNDALVDSELLLLAAGTSLLRPGEANHDVYILLSGEMAVHLNLDLTPDFAITVSLGECVGEISAIDGNPASALVLALTEVRVLKLSRDVFWERLMAVPGVARNLMVVLSERMRSTNELTLKAQREQLELLHLRKELDVARQLQSSMLPLHRPLFPERRDIEVCGFMEAASVIGGDLFDAFFVDEHQLFFCIGDVSGHGIPAALFMARTIGLLRILAMATLQPDELLETLNERLCIGNETNIYVTLFCGFLDLESGKLRYSNGGHCAPILSLHGQSRQLPLPKGALIGAFPNLKFASIDYALNPGEMLFCYTDGVTEAQNPLGEEFSEDRCLKIIDQTGLQSLPALLDAVRREVVGFTGSELFDDDCTMLAILRPLTGRNDSF